MANTVNKVVYNGQTLIDLSNDDVQKSKVLAGTKFHAPNGALETGTCDFDVNSSGATATDDMVLKGLTYAKGGQMRTGNMTNNGAVDLKITTKEQEVTVPQGYHDGAGKVAIDATEQAKLISTNIREGVEILGVTGTMTGMEDEKPQNKEVTPSAEQQVIVPDDGYTCLRQVTVAPIPYTESENAAGGMTVTIG